MTSVRRAGTRETLCVAYVGEDGIEPNVAYHVVNGKMTPVEIAKGAGEMSGRLEYDPAAERDAYCEDCGNEAGQCECDPLAMLIEDVTNTLGQLDKLAEVWGDEGVFRRCRDALRAAVKKAERWTT